MDTLKLQIPILQLFAAAPVVIVVVVVVIVVFNNAQDIADGAFYTQAVDFYQWQYLRNCDYISNIILCERTNGSKLHTPL